MRSWKLPVAALGAVTALWLAAPAFAAPTYTITRPTFGGTVVFEGLKPIGSTSSQPTDMSALHGLLANRLIEPDAFARPSSRAGIAGSRPTSPPVVAGDPVTTSNSGFSGFNGLNHQDHIVANGGDPRNVAEPPDQALCVGNGFVVEGVNVAFSVYDSAGNRLAGPAPANSFFNLDPTIFASDPKCYFDPDTHRFFATIVDLPGFPTGDTSEVDVAVSRTDNPLGAWDIFRIDTTDLDHSGCPCAADQPLIGADAFGFYVSTNEFTDVEHGFANAEFTGAQVYAMSKRALEVRALPPVVHIANLTVGGDPAASIQPATTPSGRYELRERGTEYFLSSLDFNATLDNRIATWALTNTFSLLTPQPNVTLTSVVLNSEAYGQPPDMQQVKDGPRPLADLLQLIGGKRPPLEPITSNDDRMNQVVFAHGHLWGGVNTILVSPRGGEPRAGIAYFVVNPDVGHEGVRARIDRQGYVAVERNHVVFPSIGVTDSGKAVMTASIIGADFFPSVVYVPLGSDDDHGFDFRHGGRDDNGVVVHLAGPGAGPDDGVTGYSFFASGSNDTAEVEPARWGDYSAAVATPDGTIFFAAENTAGGLDRHVTVVNGKLQLGPSIFANWGTFIGRIRP
jgi:hypothetical protein